MAKNRDVQGIENMPIYIVSVEEPWTISSDDLIDNISLRDLVK